jgi:hypothetical protein
MEGGAGGRAAEPGPSLFKSGVVQTAAGRRAGPLYISIRAAMNENFSLYVMCFFLLASLAFLAQQITAYH